MGKTFQELEQEHKVLTRNVNDFELGLKGLRGPNALFEVEKDQREAVKILYEGYLKAKTDLDTFEGKTFTEDVPVDPTPVDDGSIV